MDSIESLIGMTESTRERRAIERTVHSALHLEGVYDCLFISAKQLRMRGFKAAADELIDISGQLKREAIAEYEKRQAMGRGA